MQTEIKLYENQVYQVKKSTNDCIALNTNNLGNLKHKVEIGS